MNNYIKEYKDYLKNFKLVEEDKVDSIVATALTAVLENNIDCIDEDIKNILSSYEVASELLGLDENDVAKSAYQYGRVHSVAVFVNRLNTEYKQLNDYNEIMYKYKYLNPLVEYVNIKGYVSGADICKHLEFKSRSSLTNFMKRIEEKRLFNVDKIGNSNYYSLSINGEKYNRYLETIGHNKSNKNSSLTIYHYFTKLMEKIAEELRADNPDIYNIINSANLEMPGATVYDSPVIANYLKKIFMAHNDKMSETIKNKVIYFDDWDITSSYKKTISDNAANKKIDIYDWADNIIYDL